MQTDRLVSVTTNLGPDVLMLTDFAGTEGISMPFSLKLGFVSDDPKIVGADLLRTPALVTIQTEEGERHIHGLINRFSQLGQVDDLTVYQAEVVPWLWFLTLSRDCRIFQEKSVPEIIQNVFKDLGYTDYKLKCSGNHPKRTYCVQYRETHFDFVSRLMEEEGIFYFFEHTDKKHTLVVADNNGAMTAGANGKTFRMATGTPGDQDVVTSLVQEHAIHVGKMTLKNYDFLQPNLGLLTTIAGKGKEEVYDYPAGHTTPEEGDRLARLGLEMEEARGQVVRGESGCRHLQSGHRFELQKHYRSDLNKPYVVTQVQHSARAEDYRSWGSATAKYSNTFLCIPADVPYRPLRVTAKTLVHGSQTARVVGPAGEEIYVDAHSRVKVQFYWDREGKKDEHSSCWVRVASGWAGKQWGMVHIPRIGQEVVVQFLEGDPDQPIIIGSVYNAEQQPPFKLPDNKTISGLRSRSTLGGSSDTFNEISMEDEKGSELLYIHAEKDQAIVVEHDRTDSVGNDEKTDVGNDRTETVGGDESITIAGGRTETVEKDENITIGGNRTEGVGKNENITIGDNRTETVGKNETVEVGGGRSVSIAKQESLEVGEGRTTKVGKDEKLTVGKKLVIAAGDEIQISTGRASITMKKDGTIAIKGKDISITASGKVNVKASSDMTLKGSQIKEN
jgi:type VI secretion system secreted protein VgrG